ncbi:hypothetical protein [Corynebacterium stationis]|uniref:hypothetical protein n=1 Tax=Corynebacterium stationis TaxID=1705 RepID=UPI0028B11BE7|nr:hypothetical protein [Corynebacterium stationis]
MSNFDKAVEIIGELATEYGQPGGDELFGLDEDAALALHTEGLLAPDVRIIRTQKELEALELNDPDAIAVAGEAGVVRTVRALAAMHRLGSVWGLPAVVVARGAQVRAAREAMEEENG